MPSLLSKIETVPVSSLELYPGNARKGDLQAIAASLRENGQVSPLVVQQSTRRVLGGNNTLKAASEILGWAEIDVVFVDVDDKRAAKINAVLNRTADLATYDDSLLLAQLAGLDDLDGSGYAASDLDELRRITGAFGREATAFLDGFTNPPPAPAGPVTPPPPSWQDTQPGTVPPASTAGPGTAPPPPAPSQQDYVQLAWAVTPGSRETIRQAISLAQHRGALATQAEGLLAMATHYLNTFQDR